MFRFFEHTADLGLHVEAADLDGLFRDAARGLFAMIAEPAAGIEPVDTVRVRLDGERRDYLLFDWLNELLYLFDTRRLLLGGFDVRVGDAGLVATVGGRALDTDRDRLLREVKAITYHGLKVERTAGGWLAEVIVDI